MATDYVIEKVTVNGYQDGEQIRETILNRPIGELEQNVDLLFAMVKDDDPFTQYTTDAEANVIAEDNAILFAIALG